jgi:hypothetical protein
MISHASFQEQLIDALQADANLTAVVAADQIKEYQYQATEFTYPAVRVDIRSQIPEGNAPCRLTISIVNFAVFAFSEADSSLQCEQLCFLIAEALFGAQLEDLAPSQGPNWRTETVNLVQVNAPRRLAERLWRGEIIFRCRVKETS